MSAVPGVKIIQFVRTNVVKMAVSGYRGRQTHDACGESNIKSSLNLGLLSAKCTLPLTLNWTLAEFHHEVTTWQKRSDAFLDYFSEEQSLPLRSVPTIQVPYEELQLNADATFRKIFEFLGQPSAYGAYKSTRGPPSTGGSGGGGGGSSSGSSGGGGWTKRTPEDLSQLLVAFQDIEKQLVIGGAGAEAGRGVGTGAATGAATGTGTGGRAGTGNDTSSACRCWREQLVSKTAQVFARCPSTHVSCLA